MISNLICVRISNKAASSVDKEKLLNNYFHREYPYAALIMCLSGCGIGSILKSMFWMKRMQSSVRVKINEYVHAWSEFLFVSLLVIFNFFPQINHFYYFTFRHGLQDVENHCANFRDIELKTRRKIPSNSSSYHFLGNEMNYLASSEYMTVFTLFIRASFLEHAGGSVI